MVPKSPRGIERKEPVAIIRTGCFSSVNFFLEEAIATKASGKYLTWVKTISKKEILIFDDFALRQYNHEEANIILEILEDKKNKIKKKLMDYNWYIEMGQPELEKLSLDLYNIQLMDLFSEVCQRMFSF